MAVEIDLDINASEATGKIGAVAASLKGLERVADDIDIDFDVDASEITGELEELSDALDSIDLDVGKLDGRIREAAKELDDAEVSVAHDLPEGGETNDGSSSGNDPPNVDVDSFSERGLLEREYGDYTYSSNDFLAEALYKPKGGKTRGIDEDGNIVERERRAPNLGRMSANAPVFDLLQRVGTRDGFGLDPKSMDIRRKASDLSEEAISRGADGSDIPFSRQGIAGLEDTLRDFRRHGFDVSDQLQARIDARDRAASPIDTPFGDNGLNYDARISELAEGELSELVNNPNQGSGNLFREGQSDFVKRMGASFAEAQYEALGGVSGQPGFTDFNSDLRDSVPESDNDIRHATGRLDRDFASGIGTGLSTREEIFQTDIAQKISDVENLKDALQSLGNTHKGVGRQLRRLAPSMSMIYNIVSAALPAIIAFGTQLLGVAAAMGAVGAAGASIIGLGLIGHGDSMAESFQQAKVEFRDLKEEMFDEVQPLASQFAPIQGRMFDAIPGALSPVFEEMEGLTDFEDTLFNIGSIGARSLERFFGVVNSNQEKISQLTERFGELAATKAIGFFEWLINTASQNQQLIIELGSSFESLLLILYRVAMLVGRIIAGMEPLFKLFSMMAGLLNNKLLVGMLTTVTVGGLMAVMFAKVTLAVWGLISAVVALHAWFVKVSAGGAIAGMIASLQALGAWLTTITAQMTTAQMAAWGLAAAIAATGVGALVVGGGLIAGQAAMETMAGPPSGAGVSGSGNTYNDNRSFTINQGNGDYASQKSVEDTVRRVNSTDEAQQLPPVGGNMS